MNLAQLIVEKSKRNFFIQFRWCQSIDHCVSTAQCLSLSHCSTFQPVPFEAVEVKDGTIEGFLRSSGQKVFCVVFWLTAQLREPSLYSPSFATKRLGHSM